MKLITLKTFDNAIDAHLLKTKLESEGVNCYLFDENIVSLNPLYNIAVGGIKLNINKDDLHLAKDILNETEDKPLTNNENEIIHCPRCKSTHILNNFKSVKNAKGLIATVVSLLSMSLPIYSKTVYKCKDCDMEFT